MAVRSGPRKSRAPPWRPRRQYSAGEPGERNSFAKKLYLAQAAAGLPPVDSQNLVFLQVGEINAPRSVSRMIPEAKKKWDFAGNGGHWGVLLISAVGGGDVSA